MNFLGVKLTVNCSIQYCIFIIEFILLQVKTFKTLLFGTCINFVWTDLASSTRIYLYTFSNLFIDIAFGDILCLLVHFPLRFCLFWFVLFGCDALLIYHYYSSLMWPTTTHTSLHTTLTSCSGHKSDSAAHTRVAALRQTAQPHLRSCCSRHCRRLYSLILQWNLTCQQSRQWSTYSLPFLSSLASKLSVHSLCLQKLTRNAFAH